MDEFDWSLDNENESNLEDLLGEDDLEDLFNESDSEDLFGNDSRKEWDEVLDDEIKEFPKTADGMIDLFNFMKKFDYINGWQYLWDEFAEFMDIPFRLLVGLQIATRFSELNVDFPDLRPWLSSISMEDLQKEKSKNTTLTLRDVISRDLQNASLAKSISTKEDWEILRIAMGVDEHLRGFMRRDSNLITVCWIKATPIGRNGIHMAPCVDFVRKDTLLDLFEEIPRYDEIVLRDISQMDYYDVLALAMYKTPVKPIYMGPHTLLTTLLNAQVPNCVAENKYGPIVKWFIKGYLKQMTKEMRHFENPFAQQTNDEVGELTAKETEKLIREVFVFNKISFYHEVSHIFRELTHEE